MDRFGPRFAGVFLVVAAIAAYARLYWGVDFTDEAFYSALPHSFSLGFRPYAEELSLAQNAGLLLTPAYWIFERATGGTTGIVLFNRHLFFGMVLACAWLGGRVGRASGGATCGRLVAAFVFGFSYFNIPALSYNTLGALFLFGGIFLLLWRAAPGTERARPWAVAAANLCFVASAFAYPTLMLSSAAGFGASGWIAWREWKTEGGRAARAWVASAAAGGASGLLFWWATGVERVRAVLAYVGSLGYGSEDSVARAAAMVWRQLGGLAWFGAVIGLWLAPMLAPQAWWRKRPRSMLAGACVVGVWTAIVLARHPAVRAYPTDSTPVVLCLGLWFPLVTARLRDRSLRRDLWVVVGVPAFMAAAAVAWSSSNGLVSSTIGLFPAATAVCLVLPALAQQRDSAEEQVGGWSVLAVCFLLMPLLFLLGRSLLTKSYRDEARPFGGVATVAASGPYAGIRTSAEKARKVAALAEDIGSLERSGRTLLVLGDMPGGYLFSRLRPRTVSTWLFWSGRSEIDEARLRGILAAPAGRPDWILQAEGAGRWTDSELERAGYETHLRRDEFGYRILRGTTTPAGVLANGRDDE